MIRLTKIAFFGCARVHFSSLACCRLICDHFEPTISIHVFVVSSMNMLSFCPAQHFHTCSRFDCMPARQSSCRCLRCRSLSAGVQRQDTTPVQRRFARQHCVDALLWTNSFGRARVSAAIWRPRRRTRHYRNWPVCFFVMMSIAALRFQICWICSKQVGI